MQQNQSSRKKLKVLVVDDEINIRKTLAFCLNAEGHSTIAVSTFSDALGESRQHVFDLAFIDIRLGESNGLELIPILAGESPWTKLVVMTAYASVKTAVEAMRQGAFDYLEKPFTPDQIKLLVNRIAKIRQMETEIDNLKDNIRQLGPEISLQSSNPEMMHVLETAKKAASSDAIILLTGESGTGKTVLAREIHSWSPRAAMPMMVVSCPAVPQELFESELFGHAQGAFTGASRDNPGRIAQCEGGTFFLDEISEIPLSAQTKLLRFLQEKEYERLGETTVRKADVRIITATNRDLEESVREGTFREDLFHRINVISLTIPPLRKRKEDLPVLAAGFLAHFGKTNHKCIHGFTEKARAAILAHDWPGNIRELRNAIERAVILGKSDMIDVHDLTDAIQPPAVRTSIGDDITLASLEEAHIRKILARSTSLQEAADILGIDQATLWRKRKAYKI